METEHDENEGMRRLLGGALDDVDFDADVVPAVLAGYDRGVRTRRYQAAGAALAVLAVTAATATLLPRSGAAKVGPGDRGSTATSPPTGPATAKPRFTGKAALDLSRCGHERWEQLYSDGMPAPGGTLSRDPEADRANCRALLSAVVAVFPDATVTPAYYGELTFDPRVNQDAIKKDQDKGSTPDLMRDAGAEKLYLSTHPDDPANVYSSGGGTITTPAGRETFQLQLGGIPSPTGEDDPLTCGAAGVCTPVASDGWHGALTSKPKAMGGTEKTVVLTDGRKNSIYLALSGVDETAWYQAGAYRPEGGGPADRDKWVNRWTGETITAQWPPATPALTDAQWVQLLQSKAFSTYLDSFVKYRAKLPVDPDHAPH